MEKKIRFPLKMEDEVEVRTLSELKDNFSLTKVLNYISDGKLITWLRDRYEDDIADAIEKLDSNHNEFPKQICNLFNIDNVAFCQNDLYDLLDSQYNIIYLYGDKFEIPLSKNNVTYIGFNNPIVIINTEKEINWKEKKIILSKVQFDDKYKKLLKNKEVIKVSMSQKAKDTMINTIINCITNHFGSDLITNDVINAMKQQATTSLKDVPDDKELTEDIMNDLGKDILDLVANKMGVDIPERDKKEFMELFLNTAAKQRNSAKQEGQKEITPEKTKNQSPSNNKIINNPITRIKTVEKKIAEVPNNEIPKITSNQSLSKNKVDNRPELIIKDQDRWFWSDNVGKYAVMIYKKPLRCYTPDILLTNDDIKISYQKIYNHIDELDAAFSQGQPIWYNPNFKEVRKIKEKRYVIGSENSYLAFENRGNWLNCDNWDNTYHGRFAVHNFDNGFQIIVLLERDNNDIIVQDNRQWYLDTFKLIN